MGPAVRGSVCLSRAPHPICSAVRSAHSRLAANPARTLLVRCATKAESNSTPIQPTVPATRRDSLLLGGLAAAAAGLVPAAQAGTGGRDIAEGPEGSKAKYNLPKVEGAAELYRFKPSKTQTPALRAETLEPYSFYVPGEWKPLVVPNALSGSYCQPSCDEPTTEVKWGGDTGYAQVIISPLIKLTRKKFAKIDEVATVDELVGSIGPYITGDTIEPEEVVSATSFTADDGHVYYLYEFETPYALAGIHNLACVTTTKNTLALLAVSVKDDKQWELPGNQEVLKEVVKSFRVAS